MQLFVIVVTFLVSLLTIMMSSKNIKFRHSSLLICLLATIILAVFASRAFSDYLPIEIVLFDCVLVVLNFLGVLVSVFYVSKIELYAGLPSELPHLSSYGPEVGLIYQDTRSTLIGLCPGRAYWPNSHQQGGSDQQ